MKYNYDKKALQGLSVGPFLNQVKLRTQKIEEAPDTMPVSVFNANRLAKALHPDVQHVKFPRLPITAAQKAIRLSRMQSGARRRWPTSAQASMSVYPCISETRC